MFLIVDRCLHRLDLLLAPGSLRACSWVPSCQLLSQICGGVVSLTVVMIGLM